MNHRPKRIKNIEFLKEKIRINPCDFALDNAFLDTAQKNNP